MYATPDRPAEERLGSLTFSLSAPELKAEAERLIADAEGRVHRLLEAPGTPTPDRFLLPLDEVLLQVRDISNHGALLFVTHSDAEVRAAGREVSEAADRFYNSFRLNAEVYRRLGELDLEQADEATRHAVHKLRREMRRAGVERTAAEREGIARLTNSIDETANQFHQNIASGQRTFEVPAAEGLSGLPDDYRAAHPTSAQGTARITTAYPDILPVLGYSDSAGARQRALFEFLNIASPQNEEVLARLLQQRRELVDRLGYSDYAAYATEDKMMERPEAVTKFLNHLSGILDAPTHGALKRTLARKQKDVPSAQRLELWDMSFWGPGYYDTKLRQETYGVDPRALRAYLPYGAIRDGLMALCGELFGLTFRRQPTAAVWHPSVEAFDVERDGRHIGRCYLDLIPRPDKYNHAACFAVREGVRDHHPHAALICNFIDPNTPPETARMEYRDVVTFFHEFGHLLHALLSGHGPWVYTTMASVELDFIEAPSQLFEEWARDPATLSRFARNPDTGEPVPADLLKRLKASEAMGRASRDLRQVALAAASLELYRRDPKGLDPNRLFREVWDRTYPAPIDPSYHPVLAWGHLTGYSACYYTYLWSSVIARDLLSPFFEASSLTDPATAQRYAREILEPGGRRPAHELVERFLGRPFRFDAYERWVAEDDAAAPAR